LATLMHETAVPVNAKGWTYAEVRPIKFPANVAHPVTTDCSGGCITLCKWGGAPDPSGNNFDGSGNSTSFFEHLPHITADQATTGDLIVFGPSGDEHAVMVYGPGADPQVWSHGQQGDPHIVALSAEKAAHPGALVTFLRTL
jgi:hypothetical protein